MTTPPRPARKPRQKSPTPQPGYFDPRLRYRHPIAAQLLGVSQSKLYAMIRDGKMPVIREGGNSFIAGTTIEAACRLTQAA